MRRALSETLIEIVSAMGVTSSAQSSLKVSDFMMDLPLEITVPTRESGDVLADVPRWRWPTDFDAPLSRLKITGDVETGLAPSLPPEAKPELGELL
jgi:hypothetical protein